MMSTTSKMKTTKAHADYRVWAACILAITLSMVSTPPVQAAGGYLTLQTDSIGYGTGVEMDFKIVASSLPNGWMVEVYTPPPYSPSGLCQINSLGRSKVNVDQETRVVTGRLNYPIDFSTPNGASCNTWYGGTYTAMVSDITQEGKRFTGTFHVSNSVPSSTGAGSVTFTSAAGEFPYISAVSEGSLPIEGKPSGVSFPFGFYHWINNHLSNGQKALITLTYPTAIPAGSQYFKFINGAWVNATSLLGSNDGDNIITLSIVDGGFGDSDGLVNGEVSDDPGGVAIPGPDAKVAAITVSRTFAYAGVSSQPIGLKVSVANQGLRPATFTITARANSTLVGTQDVTLDAKASTVVSFSWDVQLSIGNYLLSAEASLIPGEVNPADNSLTMVDVFQVRKAGDVDGDADVDIDDLIEVFLHQFTASIPSYYDIDNDGDVDIDDLINTFLHQFT
jgi:hypothetical protein